MLTVLTTIIILVTAAHRLMTLRERLVCWIPFPSWAGHCRKRNLDSASCLQKARQVVSGTKEASPIFTCPGDLQAKASAATALLPNWPSSGARALFWLLTLGLLRKGFPPLLVSQRSKSFPFRHSVTPGELSSCSSARGPEARVGNKSLSGYN